MVFQSVPLFLDPPNWHHQEQNQQPLIPNHDSLLHVIPQPPTTTGAVAGGSGGAGMGSIRPGSMADRARLAKLPQPEPGLKCPRCESTNTKFCYFNNYSLSQPRHFCKTCRRYWTRGGALRNVPVGGGCRRSNKRSKRSNSRSKSPTTAMTDRSCGSINNTNLSCSSTSSIRGSGGRGGGGGLHNMNSHLTSSLQPQLPFLLGGYGPSDIGLHTGGIQPPPMAAGGGGSADMNFQMGGSSSGGLISSHHQPFRLPLHQFPFLTGLEEATPPPPPHAPQLQPPGNELYPFQGSNHNVELIDSGAKMEENDHEGLALSSKNFLEIHGGNDQYNWSTNGGNAWPDLL